MDDFLRVNDGLARRIPFRYTFEAYSVAQLTEIFRVMCDSKGEQLEPCVLEADYLPAMLESIDAPTRESQNAGLIANLVAFAQIERDRRIGASSLTCFWPLSCG